jgi:hypothetical protein
LDVNVVALLVRMAVMTYPGGEVEAYDMDQREVLEALRFGFKPVRALLALAQQSSVIDG